jgi:integrase/recombinase XerD
MLDTGSGTTKLGPAAVLSEAEVRAVLATFSRRAPTGIRNYALTILLWRTGLRVSEALDLELRDLSPLEAPATLLVRNGKGGRSRIAGVHQEAAVALERWRNTADRLELGRGRRRPLFCTITRGQEGRPLHPSYVRTVLAAKGKRAGVARCHPHAFRATLAVELAREGVPVATIRDVLGHANIAQTDAYLRRVFPELSVAAVVNRDPEPAPSPADLVLARLLEALTSVGVPR